MYRNYYHGRIGWSSSVGTICCGLDVCSCTCGTLVHGQWSLDGHWSTETTYHDMVILVGQQYRYR